MTEQKRLDRPELREKIRELIYYDCTDCPYINEGTCIEPSSCKLIMDKADQILALIPDIEEAKKPLLEEIKHLEGIIESLSNQ